MIFSILGILLVSELLNSIAPQPGGPCPAVEWYDEDNCSATCKQCKSCKEHAKHFHMHQCITKKIPQSSEALCPIGACTEIQRAKHEHRNSTFGAIAYVKDNYGIGDRKFKYGNMPYVPKMEIEWYRLIFSSPEFVSALSAYLIASWNHASFNMYERDT